MSTAEQLPEDAAAVAPAEWSSLPIELLPRIATFLDIYGGDLLNYCVVVGPGVSSMVRRSVLHKNDDYLRYCTSLMRAVILLRRQRKAIGPTPTNGEHDATAGEVVIPSMSTTPKEKVLQWMEENTDWKDRCTGHICSGEDDREIRLVRRDAVRFMKFKKSLGGLIAFAGWAIEEWEANVLAGNVLESGTGSLPKKGDILTAVDGFGVPRGASPEEVLLQLSKVRHESVDLALAFDTVSLNFEHHPNMMFISPAPAVEMDLDVILRVMIEEKDMEAQLEAYRSPADLPLTWVSLFYSPTSASLRYLLTRPCFVQQCNAFEMARCKIIHVAAITPKDPFAAFSALVSCSNIDVDATTETVGLTALHLLCIDDYRPNTAVKIRLLLDAGADPTLAAESGRTPIDTLSARIDELEDESKALPLREALTMMEQDG